MVLLVSAGLLLRSLNSARDVDLGMDPRNVLAFSLDLEMRGHSPAAGQKSYRDLAERGRALPGVESETLRTPLLAGRGFDNRDDEAKPLVAVVNQTLAKLR